MPAPLAGQRSGAHRPRRPVWHDLVPALVVVAAVLVLALTAYQFRDSIFGSSSSANTGASVPDDQDAGQGVAPTAPTTSGSAGATHTSSPTTTAPASSPTSTAPAVDRTLKIAVYNSTTEEGLAAGATTKLKGAGWKAQTAGNERRFSTSTTVYFGSADLKATAQAVNQDLGGYRTKLSTTYGSGAVTVVLGTDYQP